MFHDTIPGSSIRLAVEDYDREFAKILETGHEMKASAIKAMQSRVHHDNGQDFVLNTLPGIARREAVHIRGDNYKVFGAGVGELQAEMMPVHPEQAVTGEGCLVRDHAMCILTRGSAEVEKTPDGAVLKNAFMIVKIAAGRITSIYDTSDS